MSSVIKSGVTLTGAPLTPPSFLAYKRAVELDGGVIGDEAHCAAAFALADRYGVTSGVAVSPAFGVRLMDGCIEKLYGLFGADIANPYLPGNSDAQQQAVPLATVDGFPCAHYIVNNTAVNGVTITSTPTLPASESFAVTSSIVACVAVKSPTINSAIEGYLVTKGSGANVARRLSVSNEPLGGLARARVRSGTSVFNTVYGLNASASGWKVTGAYSDFANVKVIEGGEVTGTVAASLFLATDYTAKIGMDANNSGAYNSRAVEAYYGEAWAIPDASEAFAIALNQFMSSRYEP